MEERMRKERIRRKEEKVKMKGGWVGGREEGRKRVRKDGIKELKRHGLLLQLVS